MYVYFELGKGLVLAIAYCPLKCWMRFSQGPIWTDTFDAFSAIDKVNSCLFHYAAEQDELITDYRFGKLNAFSGTTVCDGCVSSVCVSVCLCLSPLFKYVYASL